LASQPPKSPDLDVITVLLVSEATWRSLELRKEGEAIEQLLLDEGGEISIAEAAVPNCR